MADQIDPMQAIGLGMDPNAAAALQQKQMLAQLALAASQQPIEPQQPARGVGPYYRMARASPLSGLARIAEAVLGAKAQKEAYQGNAQMMAKALAGFGGAQGSPQAPIEPGSGQSSPPAPMSGYSGNAGAQDVTPQVAQGAPQMTPMNPTGLPALPLLRLYLNDPAKYLEAIKGTPDFQNALLANGGNLAAARAQMLTQAKAALETPEIKNAIFAAGGNVPTAQASVGNSLLTPEARNANFAYGNGTPNARAIVADKLIKDASAETRSGGITQRPNPQDPSQLITIRAPNMGQNQDLMVDKDGNPVSTHLVPGTQAAVGQLTAAEEAAKESNELKEFTGPNGEKVYMRMPIAPTSPSAGGRSPASGTEPSPYGNFFPGPKQQTTGAKDYQAATGKESGDFASTLADDSNGALEVRRGLHEMGNLARQTGPNASNAIRAKFYQLAIAAGVSPETAQAFTGLNGGALEAAKKQTANLAVASIHQMTNRGTNFDLETFMENNPNLLQTPGGFQRVLDYMDAKSASIIEKQREYQSFVKANKDLAPEDRKAEFTALWNKKQEEKIAKGAYDSRNTNTVGPTRQQLEDEARRRGLIQ